MTETTAKTRLEAVSGHLISNEDAYNNKLPEFELEDHPVDAIRELRVRNQVSVNKCMEADFSFRRLL
jgi:hypothetical protein